MENKPTLPAILAYLLSIALVWLGLYLFSLNKINTSLQQELEPHLLLSFDKTLFSDNSGRVNDKQSIAYIARQINLALRQSSVSQRYAGLRVESVAINTVDNMQIKALNPGFRQLRLEMPRNQLSRPVVVSYQSVIQWPIYFMLAGLMILLMLFIHRITPSPLLPEQQRWLEYLVRRGYETPQAYKQVQGFTEQQLTLNKQQWPVFNALHQADNKNFNEVMATLNDSRMNQLDELDLAWFMKQLQLDPEDIDTAWDRATSEDQLFLDLVSCRVSIRKQLIPMTKTPLFYYAWYAQQRLQGKGWMLNPQSNKPNKEQGQELAELMWLHKGHARAISDLEQSGLKAKTLDQNRSKIKEELAATLGEALAEYYLFDSAKDPESGRLRYRLKLQPVQIQLLS